MFSNPVPAGPGEAPLFPCCFTLLIPMCPITMPRNTVPIPGYIQSICRHFLIVNRHDPPGSRLISWKRHFPARYLGGFRAG